MIPRPSHLLVAAVALAASGACTHQPRSGAAGDAVVTGTVAYRERVALPPDAVVELSIIDASVSDAAAPALATATVHAEGRQVPLPFSISYDPAKIYRQHLYTIRAQIKRGGELLFATDMVRAVITQDNPTKVDLMLSRVDPTSAAAKGDLEGTLWELEDLSGDGVVSGTHVTLDFSEKGRATGNGSCNRYFSTVEMSGSSIRFGAVGATRMACATAVSLQEVKYFEALEAAHRFTIEDNTLSIFGGGSRPLRFTRATR
jgi:putative lipoprotein